MKKIILFALALFVTVGATAQSKSDNIRIIGASSIGNGLLRSDVGISDTEYNKNNISSWKKVTLSYVMPSFTEKDLNFGVSAGYHQSTKLDKDLQLFLEYGGALTYAGYSETDLSETYLDVKIPVNLAFRLNFGGNFSIIPYVGLNLKVGVLASQKITYMENKEGDDGYSETEKTLNMYSSDDMSDDAKMNRINFGIQYGVNLTYKDIALGIGFENDFTKSYTDNKYSSMVISVGYLF